MRILVAVLLLLATPAFALDLRDTMEKWKQASIEERAVLLKQTWGDRKESRTANRDELMTCMDQVAATRLLLRKRVVDMIEFCMKRPAAD
jgi:hypothetical protein